MTYQQMGFSHDPYPQLRQVVAPQLALLPPAMLQARIDQAFGIGAADSVESELEGVFDGIGRAFSSAARDVGRFAQQAAPAVAHVGGGVLQGAMAGSSAGLPGIIAGAAVGGTGAGLSRYGSGTARNVGNALNTATNFASQLTPAGRAGAALGGTVSNLGGLARGGPGTGQRAGQMLLQGAGNLVGGLAGGGMGGMGGMLGQLGGMLGRGGQGGALGQVGSLLGSPQAMGMLSGLFGGQSAAGQLASAMRRPEVHQAIAASQLGQFGANTIPVGSAGTQVPVANFAQMLARLAQQAAQDAAESMAPAEAEAADLAFMVDSAGEFIGDPAMPDDRAGRLWDVLNEAQAERLIESIGELSEGELEAADDEIWNDDSWYAQDDYDQLDIGDDEVLGMAYEMEGNDAW
jgi:hypothetical protein